MQTLEEKLTGLTRYRFETVKRLFRKAKDLTVLQVQVCHKYETYTHDPSGGDFRKYTDYLWRDATFADIQELKLVG